MADQVVLVPGTGTVKVDTSELTVGANTVERQRMNLSDPTVAAALAVVANSQPAGTEYGLVVREAQKGQATMANSHPVVLSSDHSSVPVTEATLDAAAVAQGTTASTKVVMVGGKTADTTPQYKEIPLYKSGVAVLVQSFTRSTYVATFRLAVRPYALSNAFGAAGRKQYATIFHGSTSTKTVKIKRVEVAAESATAAAIVGAELVRLSSATTPATGNPAITPTLIDPSNSAAEATCLSLPTTAGTEAGVLSTTEWNLGITAAGSVVNPPPGLNWYTLWPTCQGATESHESQYPLMRAGTAEGYSVTFDSSAASTIKAYVVIEFTEE